MYYCYNCEAPATHGYIGDKDIPYRFCYTCKNAFELGQVNPDKDVLEIDELDLEDDEAERQEREDADAGLEDRMSPEQLGGYGA